MRSSAGAGTGTGTGTGGSRSSVRRSSACGVPDSTSHGDGDGSEDRPPRGSSGRYLLDEAAEVGTPGVQSSTDDDGGTRAAVHDDCEKLWNLYQMVREYGV